MAKAKSLGKIAATPPPVPNPPSSFPYWVGIGMAIMLVAYSTHFLDPVLMPKFFGLSFLLLGVGLYRYVRVESIVIKDIFKDGFVICYVVYFVWTLLSCANSGQIGKAWIELAKILLGMGVCYYAVVFYIKSPNFHLMFSRIVSIFVLGVSLVAIFQFLKMGQSAGVSHEKLYLIEGGMGHRNILSEILFLCFPLSWAGRSVEERGFWRNLQTVAAVAALLMMLGLLSRSIWVTWILAGLVTSVLYYFIESRKATLSLTHSLKFAGITGGIAVGIICLYGYLDSFDTLKKQANSLLHPTQYQSNSDRLQKWQQSWELFRQNPILGVGLGDWETEILQFPARNSETEKGKLTFQRPHNDYLWVLSESGLVAGLAYIGMFLTVLFSLIRLLYQTQEYERRKWQYALFLGLLGYWVYANFGFPKERIETIFLLNLYFACVLHFKYVSKSEFIPAKNRKKIELSVVIFVVLFCLYIGKERAQAELILRKYQIVEKAGNTKQAIGLANQALRPLYQIDPTSVPIRYMTGTGWLQLQRLPEAIRDFKEALAISPYHPQTMCNLAACYFNNKQNSKADSLYQKVIYYAPKYEDALMSIAVVEYNKGKLGNMGKALEYMCAIDTSSITPKYHQQIQLIADSLAINLQRTTPDSLVSQAIGYQLANKKRYHKIYLHCKDKRPFLTQLRAESLYYLYENKKINTEIWESWKKKYDCAIAED